MRMQAQEASAQPALQENKSQVPGLVDFRRALSSSATVIFAAAQRPC